MRIHLQRVLIATASLVIVALVLIVFLQNRRLEQFMTQQKDMDMTGDTLLTIDNVDATQCELECQKNPACKAAVVKNKNTCVLKSTLGVPVQNMTSMSLRFPCELYDDIEFQGKGVPLDVGKYTLSDLEKKGYMDRSLMSVKIMDGYKLTVYDEIGFGGNRASFTNSQPNLGVVVRDPTTEPTRKWTGAVRSVVVKKTT